MVFANVFLELEKLGPPAGQKQVEAMSPRSADGKNSKRIVGADWRRVVFAEEVELREHDAVGPGGELGRIRRDLAPELVIFLLPVHRIDRNEERQKARSLDVTEKLKA
jgi:hypothetical protein